MKGNLKGKRYRWNPPNLWIKRYVIKIIETFYLVLKPHLSTFLYSPLSKISLVHTVVMCSARKPKIKGITRHFHACEIQAQDLSRFPYFRLVSRKWWWQLSLLGADAKSNWSSEKSTTDHHYIAHFSELPTYRVYEKRNQFSVEMCRYMYLSIIATILQG